MADNATIRLNKVLRELNISLDRAVDFLASKGHKVEARPTTKISEDIHQVLLDEFQTDMSKRVASQEVGEEKRKEKEAIRLQLEQEQEEKRLEREKRTAAREVIKAKVELSGPKQVGKIDLESKKKAKSEPEKTEDKPSPKEEKVAEVKEEIKVEKPIEKVEPEVAPEAAKTEDKEVVEDKSESPESITTKYKKLSGPKIMGDKIDLSKFNKPKKKKEPAKEKEPSDADKRKRRKRIVSSNGAQGGRGRTAAKKRTTIYFCTKS